MRLRTLLIAPLCRLVGHRRSGRRAYFDAADHRWKSVCRRCGAPMAKQWPSGWQVERARRPRSSA